MADQNELIDHRSGEPELERDPEPYRGGSQDGEDLLNNIDPNYNEEEEEKKYFRRKRLGVIKNVIAVSLGNMLMYSVYLGLLQMQFILHYDSTYREVKYSNIHLKDIDEKVLMGINVAPIISLLYTPLLIRFFGTKWVIYLATGIYALFVSTNYWERYYTLVPAATAIGTIIVPLWASLGNYITRMGQKYCEFVHYKDHQDKPEQLTKDKAHKYIITFQCIFYAFFELSFVWAELPFEFFIKGHLKNYNHTLYNVKSCGTYQKGMIAGLNSTILDRLPKSMDLIIVESVLMGVAFSAMLIVLLLCGSAYRPTEEIDLRSIGWGNIFQLPFKHMRDYRLRLLTPFFIYGGFELLFFLTGYMLSYGVCALGLEAFGRILITFGVSAAVGALLSMPLEYMRRGSTLFVTTALHLFLIVALFAWAPQPRDPTQNIVVYAVAALWGLGSGFNSTGLSILLGITYEDKNRQDFIFTIAQWWKTIAIFITYLWTTYVSSMKVKLSVLLVCLLVALLCYLVLKHKVKQQQRPRLPHLPRPRRRNRGYRYFADEQSDTDSEDKEADGEDNDNADGEWEEPSVRERRMRVK
uniref:Unc-93 homolog B1, TLR signaling regulator n=2 Tax=Eptatretus burgeri TaxID=7764 RepID=A0A8C4NBR7_EPTBU